MRTLLRLLPAPFRLSIKLAIRKFNDLINGISGKIANSKGQLETANQIQTIQTIKKSYLYENKLHNLRLATSSIQEYVIKPDEIFSFWNCVGKPIEKNGYRKGRNLVNGKLSEQVGGGLCQVAGIIYHTAIQASLKVLERYHHSIDIYQEHERFTPLGADATIVYGYKDLRLLNTYPFDIKFQFEVTDEQITCILMGSGELDKNEISFKVEEQPGKRLVTTMSTNQVLTTGEYSIIG